MNYRLLAFLLLLCSPLFGFADNEAIADSATVDDLAWLAGVWRGQGDGGGEALSTFSNPVDGSMSWVFRWNVPDDNHVHYAFTVYQDTDDGVTARGIHRGREFETFEKTHWTYALTSASVGEAVFSCVSKCRARSVTFHQLENGQLEESYTSLDGKERHFVVLYRRDTIR